MPSLDSLLSRVVERKGFTVQGSDAEALFARKGDETLLAAWKLDGPLAIGDAQMFLAAMEQIHAGTGILVAAGGIEPTAREALAANKDVEVWAESRLVMEVGEAFVKDALDTSAPATAPAAPGGRTAFPAGPSASGAPTKAPASASGAAYFMPNRKKEVPIDMQAQIPQKAGALGYAWGGPMSSTVGNPGIAQVRSGRNPSKKVDQWGNLIDPNNPRPGQTFAPAMPAQDNEIVRSPRKRGGASAQTAAPVAAPARSAFVEEPEAYEIITTPKKSAAPAVKEIAQPSCSTLRMNVSREEAAAKAGKPGNARLALVPHVAFEYDLQMSRPGMGAPVAAKGAVLVNSISGELRNVDSLDYATDEPADARKDAEKLTAVDVYDKVKSQITKTYSRTLSVEREVAGNTVMENLKLVPDPEEMGLEHRGIVHLPVWEITASTGVIRVDAFTGNLL